MLAAALSPGAATSIKTLELIDCFLQPPALQGPALLPNLAALRLVRCRGRLDDGADTIAVVLRPLLVRLPGLRELTVHAADGYSLQAIPPALI